MGRIIPVTGSRLEYRFLRRILGDDVLRGEWFSLDSLLRDGVLSTMSLEGALMFERVDQVGREGHARAASVEGHEEGTGGSYDKTTR